MFRRVAKYNFSHPVCMYVYLYTSENVLQSHILECCCIHAMYLRLYHIRNWSITFTIHENMKNFPYTTFPVYSICNYVSVLAT